MWNIRAKTFVTFEVSASAPSLKSGEQNDGPPENSRLLTILLLKFHLLATLDPVLGMIFVQSEPFLFQPQRPSGPQSGRGVSEV